LEFSALAAHKWRDALDAMHAALKIDSGFVQVYLTGGIAYAELGKADSAEWAWDQAYKMDPVQPGVRAYRVWRYMIAGNRAEAQKAFDEFDRTIRGNSRLGDMVVAQLALGNRGAALDALEAAAKQRSFYVTTAALGCDPTYGALWQEPRFLAIVKALGQEMCVDIAPALGQPRTVR
ncbi:MAG: hypothetical protein ACRD3J_16425, partial [Thermoanaerobaculia bacterium]